MPIKNTKLHFDNHFVEHPVPVHQVLLYQAGDCLAKPNFDTSEHRQVCDEITYIVSGKAQFYLNGKGYEASAGDLFFCPKDSMHNIVSSDSAPVRYYYLGYIFRKDHPSYPRWREIDEAFLKIENPKTSRAFNMNHLFSDLLGQFQQDFDKREMMIELCIGEILLYTYKYFTKSGESTAVYEKRVPNKRELAYEILSYIDNNVLRITNLNDISRYIGFSYSYTSQIFNSVMGMSLSSYYQKKRFEEAEKLLLDGVTVTSTAEILGFDTVHSFSRAFKTRYGTSPQNFIRQNKK